MSQKVIVCIRDRRYPEAANFIVKMILKRKINTLSEQKRDLKTRKVEKMVSDKHAGLLSRYASMNITQITPMEIAEEVYRDIMLELMPESTNHKSLLEQLEDEEQ